MNLVRQTGEFIIPRHGAIIRWLFNGLRRSKWPIGTAVKPIEDSFEHASMNIIYFWLRNIFDPENNIEVIAALYVFKTARSITLYEGIQQQQKGHITLPHVLVTLVLEYLSSQPGAGGEYDTAQSLLNVVTDDDKNDNK